MALFCYGQISLLEVNLEILPALPQPKQRPLNNVYTSDKAYWLDCHNPLPHQSVPQ